MFQNVVLIQILLNHQAKDLGDIFNLEQQQFRKNCFIICRPREGEMISLMISQFKGLFLEYKLSDSVCVCGNITLAVKLPSKFQ